MVKFERVHTHDCPIHGKETQKWVISWGNGHSCMKFGPNLLNLLSFNRYGPHWRDP